MLRAPALILVVDDEENIAMLTGHFLKRSGLRTLVATSGRQALELWNPEVAMLLTDCAMLQFTLTDEESGEFYRRIDAEKENLQGATRSLLQEERVALARTQEALKRLLDVYLSQSIDRGTYEEEQAKLQGEKRTLTEQMGKIEGANGHWLEPFRSFLKTAQNVGEISQTGSLFEKKNLAVEIFGSNLVLGAKKARGSAINPWNFIREKPLSGGMVPRHGLEP